MNPSDITSILLPAARVDFFVSDGDTAATAEKLAADWRFARVEVNVRRADIHAATAFYAQNPSPDLLFIETDDIGDGFLPGLESLAGVCAEGTDAVIIGPTNDVHLYRKLVGMGVRDYLVRPLREEDIVGIVAAVLVEKHGISGARLIPVVGGKGGVGATSVAQILATAMAGRLGQKTLLMDVAGSNSTLGVSFGLEPAAGFAETVRIGISGSEDDLRRVVQPVTDNLSVLVCGGDPVLSVRPDPDSVEGLVKRLLQKNPVIVMDLSGASRAVQKRMVALGASVVTVTTPLLTALRNTRTYMAEINAIRSSLNEVDMVVNMTGMAGGEEMSLKDIETALGKPASCAIPYSPKVFARSESVGKPIADDAVIGLIVDIAARAAGIQAPPAGAKGAKGGLFSFIGKK